MAIKTDINYNNAKLCVDYISLQIQNYKCFQILS